MMFGWKMNKLLKYAGVIGLCICICSLSGCFSAEQRQYGKDVRSAAKAAVKDYLPEKYGFKAKILWLFANSRTQDMPPFKSYYTGDANATCIHEGVKFNVDIDTDNGIVMDDYQIEDIKRDLAPYIQSLFSDDTYIIPQKFEVNRLLYSTKLDECPQGFWGKDQFYDGDMEHFIGSVLTSESSRCMVTLTIGVTDNNMEDVMRRAKQNAEALQNYMQNRAHITLAFYDSDKFSVEDMQKAAEDYDTFALNLLREIKNFEAVVKVSDYIRYVPAPAIKFSDGKYTEKDFLEICEYTINGIPPERENSYSLTDSYNDVFLKQTDETVQTLTDYFYSDRLGGYRYNEYYRVRVNVAKLSPHETAKEKEFVILDAYDTTQNLDKPVICVPSVRIGDYLYFDCFESHMYAVGLR